jgi:2-polyprenyl-6-methoxyphenol hydroxylase-like FAD-dependent oxidoreductase
MISTVSTEGLFRVSYEVPVIDECDVLVVGGGSSGIAAAAGAARNGAQTILIERYGFLGGASTAALVGPFMTCYDSGGNRQVVRGVMQEIIDRMVKYDGCIDPSTIGEATAFASFIELGHDHVTPFDPEALKLAALELLTEYKVKLFFYTYFIDTLTENGKIIGVVVTHQNGFGIIKAKRVIDASGDGNVAAKAGTPFEIGRPSDGMTQPATLFFRMANVNDEKVKEWYEMHQTIHPGERIYECIVREAKQKGEFTIPREYVCIYRMPRPGEWRVNTTRIHNIDGTKVSDLSRAEIEGRRQVMELVGFFVKNCPGFENAYLLDIGAQVGIRETRRIIGEYILTGDDVLAGRRFDDAIGRCSYVIDIHDPNGSRGRLEKIRGPFYDIPYRTLLPTQVENLLVAGRCISCDHIAFGTIRVIPPCYATGEAAGVAAALSIRENVTPKRLNVTLLRRTLQEQGAIC